VKFEIIQGDCREVLKDLAKKKVRARCCVTSPPYFGLRDYGHSDQIGLEESPDQYIANIVKVAAGVRDIMTDDGTLWLNLGDSYAGSGKGGQPAMYSDGKVPPLPRRPGETAREAAVTNTTRNNHRVKMKDLIGIPWRVALALRDDGWYLRSDVIEEVELFCPCGCGFVLEERIWRHSPDREIVWSKPNPMPESVTDRPTKSHEYIFLLSKRATYYYDSEAIREPLSDGAADRLAQRNIENQHGSDRAHAGGKANGPMKAVKRSGNLARKHRQDYGGNAELSGAHQGFAIPWNSDGSHRPQYKRALELAQEHGLTDAHIEAIKACGITDTARGAAQKGAGRNTPEQLRLAAEAKLALGGYYREFLLTEGRNKRSVWTVASQRYSDAHFATFPPKLIEPCILAGSARGDTVLDPFSGAGTTGLVASRHGREYIGIELNPDYIALAENRIKDDAPLFNVGAT
jgi:DNA modification methylase